MLRRMGGGGVPTIAQGASRARTWCPVLLERSVILVTLGGREETHVIREEKQLLKQAEYGSCVFLCCVDGRQCCPKIPCSPNEMGWLSAPPPTEWLKELCQVPENGHGARKVSTDINLKLQFSLKRTVKMLLQNSVISWTNESGWKMSSGQHDRVMVTLHPYE